MITQMWCHCTGTYTTSNRYCNKRASSCGLFYMFNS